VEPSTPAFVLSLIGTLTGTAGAVLSVFNYLRDRASAVVSLQWDFLALDSSNKPIGQPTGVVSIANNGRRPLYIKLVYLDVPKRSGHGPLILKRSLTGQRLGEGDAEFVITISTEAQSYLHKHFTGYWHDIHAVACDNCGRKYKSDSPKKPPSWTQAAPAGQGS
jgi:hypothetical protein